MILAAFFFSLMSLFVKVAGQRLPSQEIVLVRGVLTGLFTFLAVRWAGVSLWGQRKGWLVMRGVTGFIALSFIYFALTKLPLADATVLQYTNPVFTALLAAVFLQEPIRRRDWGGTALSLAGVVLIARPSFLFGSQTSGLDPVYVGIALLGAAFSAAAYVIVRKLRTTEHPLTIIFYFPLVSTLGSIPTALPSAIWPTPLEWLVLVVGVAGTAQLGQIYLTKGLHAEQAGRAMSMSYLQILFAAIWGALFFGEIPDVLAILGAVLVMGGTVLVTRN